MGVWGQWWGSFISRWGEEPASRARCLPPPRLEEGDAATEALFSLIATQRDFLSQLRDLRVRTGVEAVRIEDRRGALWCAGSESSLSSVSEWVWYDDGGRLQYVGGYRRVEWGGYTLVYDAPHAASVYVFLTRDRRDTLSDPGPRRT